MTRTQHREAMRTLKETFGDRIQPAKEQDPDETVASAMPVNVGEIQLLSEVAQRYSIPLVPLGAGTIGGTKEAEESILVRFDLMRRTNHPDSGESWVEAEPGIAWLEVEDELRTGGRGLAVYPTSAPRATVGGWLATDGLGVGSFEYGWLSENVISANVVLPGGELREVTGEDLQELIVPGRANAVVVSAKLRTRTANTDTPFAVSFDSPGALLEAVTDALETGVPLWHLAFLNPAMTRVRGIGKDYMLFGAYPRDRSDQLEEDLGRIAAEHSGNILDAAQAHRVWTERFFPVAPAHPTPDAERVITSASQLPEMLSKGHPKNLALQGTVARSKEVLLLTLDTDA